MINGKQDPPLVTHVIYSLSVGGLENGLVNLINNIPPERFRHAIVCLTGYDDFAERIKRDNVSLFALNKRPGKDLGLYRRCWCLFHELRPDIVHTRNLATLEMQIPAFFAGVSARVHGEHGRGADDPDGRNRKQQLIRRMVRPFVRHYIPLSGELEGYLRNKIGVPQARMSRICNGVDIARFCPGKKIREGYPAGFRTSEITIIGAVGRTEAVKDPLNLVRAFVLLMRLRPEWRERVRLVWIGDGPQFQEVKDALADGGATDLAWVPGAREDVPDIMRGFDVYVLPSLAEGISNTVMEAMATGLPVVATRVGGNAELVDDGITGTLVPRSDPESLAGAMHKYIESTGLRSQHGDAGRKRAEKEFSLDRMVSQYMNVYDQLMTLPEK